MTCIAPNCWAPQTVGSVFCETHIKAPSGQRGGWLSAHRRRVNMVSQQKDQQVVLDVSNISPRIWMGARPPHDRDLPTVDVVVLAAREYQPPMSAFHGTVLRCPLIDDNLEKRDIAKALMAAYSVAQQVANGKTVLVTCSQGRNRSGLIVGFALGHLTRMTGEQIIELVRRRRTTSGVLSNQAFCEYLKKYVDPKR